MKKQLKSNIFTGICTCGHTFDDHHHGVVMNIEPLKSRNEEYKMIHGVVGEECEAEQFEGQPLVENPCNCQVYKDKGWK
jgi:hypothetical protein